jgi:hypothetical protein
VEARWRPSSPAVERSSSSLLLSTGRDSPILPARLVVLVHPTEARHFNHSYIGTEHILLALVREPESIASEILLNLGVDPKKVREKVVELLTSAS